MKWIKAKERLPNEGYKGVLRVKDLKSDWNYNNGDLKSVQNLIRHELELYVEWLDESPESSSSLTEDASEIESAFEKLIPDVDNIIDRAINDFSTKWSSHDEKNNGVAEYAREVVSLFIRSIPTSHPIPLSIVEELEKANPYQPTTGNFERYKYDAYKECVSKLRELTQSQPK